MKCILAKVPSQFLDEELQTLMIDTTKNSNDVAEHNSVVSSVAVDNVAQNRGSILIKWHEQILVNK